MIYFESFKRDIEDGISIEDYRIYRTEKRDGIIDRYIGDLAIRNSEIFRREHTYNTNIYGNGYSGYCILDWLCNERDVFIMLMRSLV